MITPSFSPTATERVLPKLALDFTTASLDPRITFTRALNTATCINSSGYIETVNANLPRFDYTLNTGGACKGLLIEESRSNLLSYTEDWTNAFWNYLIGTVNVTADYAVAPTNVQNADRLVFAAGSRKGVQGFAITSGTTYTFSAYVKSTGTVADLNLYFADGTTTVIQPITVTSSWQRFTYTVTAGSNNALAIGFRSAGGADVAIWGMQFEPGAFMTSYIPSLTAGPVTRNADVATMTGTNFSSWYNATQGTLCVNADQSNAASGTRTMVSFSTGLTANSGIEITYANGSSRINFRYWDTVGGVAVGSINSSGFTPAADTFYESAFGYQTNNFGAATNGTSFANDVSGTVAGSANTLNFGKYFSDANFLNGHIKYFAYYPQRLLDREIQAISKQG